MDFSSNWSLLGYFSVKLMNGLDGPEVRESHGGGGRNAVDRRLFSKFLLEIYDFYLSHDDSQIYLRIRLEFFSSDLLEFF